MRFVQATITKKAILSKGIIAFFFKAPEISQIALPGQFINIRVKPDFDPFLRRPFSIADKDKNGILIVFRIRGIGTEILSNYKEGDELDIIGPLGKPISEPSGASIEMRYFLIGGGVGIAPLLFLARSLYKKNTVKLFLGAKTKTEIILLDEFRKFLKPSQIEIATEDGTMGKMGTVVNLIQQSTRDRRSCALFACGPKPMLKVLSTKLENLYGFLEEPMGCGMGICFGCAVKKKSGGYLRFCQEGPVVDLSTVVL